MEGRGRGGRGSRLMESLQQMREQHTPADVRGNEPQPSSSDAPAPPPTGRGKLLQAIHARPSAAQIAAQTPLRVSASSSGSGSQSPPSPDQPSPSGAIGGSSPRFSGGIESLGIGETRRFIPPPPEPILNKERGTDGTAIDVHTNYVMMRIKEGKGIYEYHIDFDPNIDSIQLRRKILSRSECVDIIGNIMVFTGTNMLLPIRLEEDTVVIPSQHPNDSEHKIMVKIQFIKVPPPQELIPFYNTLFRRIMQTLKLVQIQRHYFDPESRVAIPQHKLEIWAGFVTAIQELDGGLLLSCDSSHRVLRTNTARDVLMDVLRDSKQLGRNFKELAVKRLVGCVVLTRYNNKPYRIDDIAFDQNPNSTFNYADGTAIKYCDYFQKSWNITITDMKQPLLIHRPKLRKGETEVRIISLIPELSYMTGLTDDIRSDVRAMKDIAAHTRVKPEMRQQKLTEFIGNVHRSAEAMKHLSDWGLELCRTPLLTKARTMNPDKILLGEKRSVGIDPKCDWARDLTSGPIFKAVNIERWLLISHKKDAPKIEDFIKMIKQVSRNMGINIADPRRIETRDETALSYANSLRESQHPGDQIVVIITPGPSQREDRYNSIKRICCCDLPIPSQVIRSSNLADAKMRSVVQKIAIQMNCKIGGQPWAIQIPFQNCMIVGIDVYHDIAQKGKSVVGVVSSTNPAVTRWYSGAFFQNTHEEIINTLETGIVNAIKKFYEFNHVLPQRIFIYRDGVSDGQLQVVRDFEIPQIENAVMDYSKAFPDYKPKITFLVVQKRINAKVYLKGRAGIGNPAPGSVLDHTITRKNYYDFYLISQFVNQGTVTPTHYIVLYDNNEMTPDRMQKLSYKMSHLYYNWFGTVRVPAPCQYAHKLAYLMGQNVKKIPAEVLCDKLYFL